MIRDSRSWWRLPRLKTALAAVAVCAGCWGAPEQPAGRTPDPHPPLQGEALAISIAVEGRPQPVAPRRAFRSGERFRLLIRSPARLYLYVFHRGESQALALARPDSRPSAPAREVQIPAGGSRWLQMDRNPGVEEFLLFASESPLPQLAFAGETLPAGYLEEEVRSLRELGLLAEAEARPRPDAVSFWWPAGAHAGQVLLAKLALAHQP